MQYRVGPIDLREDHPLEKPRPSRPRPSKLPFNSGKTKRESRPDSIFSQKKRL